MLRGLNCSVLAVSLLATWQAVAQTKIKVGTARATVIGAVVSAREHGYFKELGLDVDIELIDAAAGALPLLARNDIQIIEGGISASLFNGVQQGLPVKIAIDSTSTPLNHYLMLRQDLVDKIKTIKDLKGKTVAINAPSSIALYEVTRILESGGLSINDVETKVIPFASMGAAYATKAIDAGLSITPFTVQLPQQNLAMKWIESDKVFAKGPLTISALMFNTDWANKNPVEAQNFFIGMMRGVRDYCDAYHHGPNRREMLDFLVANGVALSADALDAIPWPARNADGKLFEMALNDVQQWYVEQGLSQGILPMQSVIDSSLADRANAKLGPFLIQNKASPLAGCGRQ
jgi:NitT/TauT family transport system substrate-binding protein